jgi:O-succinylhomoserine sulfhydrylase
MLGDKEFIEKAHTLLKHTGPSMSPFNAWVLLKGLETLPLRAAKQAASAKVIAEHLARHRRVSRTIYPTLASHPQAELAARQMANGSTMIAFEVEGGKAGAFKASGALEVIRISNNLGDAKSLICHPSTTTHQRLSEPARLELGITQGLLRLSVGLEDVEDLIDDLDRALATVR